MTSNTESESIFDQKRPAISNDVILPPGKSLADRMRTRDESDALTDQPKILWNGFVGLGFRWLGFLPASLAFYWFVVVASLFPIYVSVGTIWWWLAVALVPWGLWVMWCTGSIGTSIASLVCPLPIVGGIVFITLGLLSSLGLAAAVVFDKESLGWTDWILISSLIMGALGAITSVRNFRKYDLAIRPLQSEQGLEDNAGSVIGSFISPRRIEGGVMVQRAATFIQWAGILAMCFMLIFPPWIKQLELPRSGAGYTRNYERVSFAFVMTPPEVEDNRWSVSPDWPLLGLRLAPVVIVSGIAFSIRFRRATHVSD